MTVRSYEPKTTTSMKAVGAGMVADTCCEPDCGMSILVEPEEKDRGTNRCISCMMRAKLRGIVK